LRIAELGGSALACARSVEGLRAVKEAARDLPGEIEPVPVDLLAPDAIQTVANAIAGRGRLDILVNNVGGTLPSGAFSELTDDDWLATFELNFFVAVKLSRIAIPYLRRSPAARIVNIGSAAAFEPRTRSPHYSCAKAALHTFSKVLSTELGPDNITVNVVAPGRFNSRPRASAIVREAKAQQVPESVIEAKFDEDDRKDSAMGRLGSPQEIARTVSFLLGADAGWITGTTFIVDGGFVRSVR
jgi:3-oxoacyl-[acyl-carrier protein] reductase